MFGITSILWKISFGLLFRAFDAHKKNQKLHELHTEKFVSANYKIVLWKPYY